MNPARLVWPSTTTTHEISKLAQTVQVSGAVAGMRLHVGQGVGSSSIAAGMVVLGGC
jgi:hypothetical protein